MSDGCQYAFIVSRFPSITETFVLREFVGLEERGLDFELFSIIRETPDKLQPEAVALDARANYISWASAEVAAAQWHWLRRSPRAYAAAWWKGWRASWQSLDALVRLPVTVIIAVAMARRMEELGVERVHVQWLTYPTLAAIVIKELTGIPFSVTAHAVDIWGNTGHRLRVAEADMVVTCTAHGRRVLVERAGPQAAAKIHLVHHGVDLGRFAELPPASPPRGRPVRLLCVAGMHDYKGHRHLLDATRVLVDRGVDAELVLIGDGPLRGELERHATASGIASRVEFMGRQPLPVVTEQLARCDIAVAPSIQGGGGRMDGIPNVLVEALAVGRPTIASDLPGIRELIVDGQTGLLSRPGDPESIADAVQRYVSDDELRARACREGRAKVEAEHDSSVNLDEVHRLLTGLCGGTAG